MFGNTQFVMCSTDMGITVEQWRASIGGWMKGHRMSGTSLCKESSSSTWFQLLVLAVLLVIGGVELNPGPNQVSIISTQLHGRIK